MRKTNYQPPKVEEMEFSQSGVLCNSTIEGEAGTGAQWDNGESLSW